MTSTHLPHRVGETLLTATGSGVPGTCPLLKQPSPFRVPVRPAPYDPYEADGGEYQAGEEPWKDYNLFTPLVVARVIDQNHDWLQDRLRDAGTIWKVLFPAYEKTSMTGDEIRSVICDTLLKVGYQPCGHTIDADWSFPTNN